MNRSAASPATPSEGSRAHAEPTGARLAALSLGALGVVFGDIGTSPLYAFRESFHERYAHELSTPNVLGVLSLIFWALVLVISIKYIVFVMRADNQGEGGILALTALVAPVGHAGRRARRMLVLFGLFGASLLYGDGIITPAISVLSAVEGLEVATPLFAPFVIPITIAILVALFSVQRRGTGAVARIFGPVTLVWFLTLAVLGAFQIARHPDVLRALSPVHGVAFFLRNGAAGFLVLGSVFLVVTGGEALYADMGHFGRRPIRLAWFALVLPALLLNYFGQGALIIAEPAAIAQPFFFMAPAWATLPLVVLATAATVIASQAVISGVFSLTRQAVQLGYLPRAEIDHTSEQEIGQIYIPAANRALMVGCIVLVLGFRSSSNLAAAYGVAVTTDMVFATLLFAAVAHLRWGWPWWRAGALAAAFLVVDLAFWGSTIVKIARGGWFPLLLAAVIFVVMTTWKTGRQQLRERMRSERPPLRDTIEQIARSSSTTRVRGTAVFMNSDIEATPPALLHNLKHNKVVHERVVVLSVLTQDVPRVDKRERVELQELSHGFYRMLLRYGFMEDPNVPRDMRYGETAELKFRALETSYFLGRERVVPSRRPGMPHWRKQLFALLNGNARSAADFYQLPPNRVVELGAQIEI